MYCFSWLINMFGKPEYEPLCTEEDYVLKDCEWDQCSSSEDNII